MSNHITVIAELGINHNGDLATAHALVALAHSCGCDAVKFQKRTVDAVYPAAIQQQPRESLWGSTVGEQKRKLELSRNDYVRVDYQCHTLGLEWFGSAWDVASVDFLESFTPPYHKIASPMLTNLDVVQRVARCGRPVFVSTGMCEWDELDIVVDILGEAGCPMALMHAVSAYPCPEPDLNLRMIDTLRRRYDLPVGYSGHEASPIPTILAIGAGAVAVERHITLDRAMYGSDQAASLERRGLEMVVAAARSWEVAAGDGVKRVLASERDVAKKLRYWEPAAA